VKMLECVPRLPYCEKVDDLRINVIEPNRIDVAGNGCTTIAWRGIDAGSGEQIGAYMEIPSESVTEFVHQLYVKSFGAI
jgi:hypothetical protein